MGTMGIGLAQGDAGLFEASWGQGAAGGSGPALQSGFCPMACFLPGPFQKSRRRQGTLAATVRAVPTASLRTLPRADRARAVAAATPSPRARPPQLTPRASACAQPHVGGVCGCKRVRVW